MIARDSELAWVARTLDLRGAALPAGAEQPFDALRRLLVARGFSVAERKVDARSAGSLPERAVVEMAACDAETFASPFVNDPRGCQASRDALDPAVHSPPGPPPRRRMLSRSRMPPRDLRRRPPHRSESRRRLPRPRKSHHAVLGTSSGDPPGRNRRPRTRTGRPHLLARRRVELRLASRLARYRRRACDRISSPLLPRLSRA